MSIEAWNLERVVAAILFWIAAMAIGMQPPEACAAAAPGSVEAGHEAFEQGRYNWYDAERDTLRPLTLPPKPAEFEDRKSVV